MADVDVVFLSRGTPLLRHLTEDAVASCLATAGGAVNVIVMEQIEDVTYEGATVIAAPPDFAYNKFANIAAATGDAEWIMVANNDLIFQEGWLDPLLLAGNDVVSPVDPGLERQAGFTENTLGTEIATHFSGWCFMLRRTLWEKIGGFDEDFTFWGADMSQMQQFLNAGVTPMIVPESKVRHLDSQTHSRMRNKNCIRTWAEVWKFEQKYGILEPRFQRSPKYSLWKNLNIGDDGTGLLGARRLEDGTWELVGR